MFSISQRAFSTILVGLMFFGAGIYAYFNHLLPSTADLSANLFTLLTPFIFILTTLKAWLDTIDSMVVEGKLVSGDIGALFGLSGFWVAEVACLSGVLEIFNIQVLSAEQQTILVNALLLFATVLLQSFSKRPPGTAASKAAKAPVVKSA